MSSGRQLIDTATEPPEITPAEAERARLTLGEAKQIRDHWRQFCPNISMNKQLCAWAPRVWLAM
jgi:hypothetical protein